MNVVSCFRQEVSTLSCVWEEFSAVFGFYEKCRCSRRCGLFEFTKMPPIDKLHVYVLAELVNDYFVRLATRTMTESRATTMTLIQLLTTEPEVTLTVPTMTLLRLTVLRCFWLMRLCHMIVEMLQIKCSYQSASASYTTDSLATQDMHLVNCLPFGCSTWI